MAKELLEHKAYVNAKSKVRLYIKDVHYLVHVKNLICSTDGEEPLGYTFPVTHPFVDDVTQCQSDVMLTYLWAFTHSKYGRRKDVRLRLLASKKPPSINAWHAFHLSTPLHLGGAPPRALRSPRRTKYCKNTHHTWHWKLFPGTNFQTLLCHVLKKTTLREREREREMEA